jgi:hypothetical protein
LKDFAGENGAFGRLIPATLADFEDHAEGAAHCPFRSDYKGADKGQKKNAGANRLSTLW